jgi:hypothetical protein
VNRTIGGIPLIYWIGALGVGILGFAWFRKKSTGTATTGAAAKTPAFSQQQEVQDFQVFQSLAGAQQASDLNFLTEVAGLFSGGSSTGTPAGGSATGGGGGGGSSSPIPSPPSTGTAPPATVPASQTKAVPPAASTPSPQSQPGYGSGVAELLAANPGLGQPGTNTPGITGYNVSYNGVPI